MNMLRPIIRPLAAAAFAALFVLSISPTRAADVAARYGGPVYSGPPTGTVTSELLAVGGSPGNFSSIRALNALAGEATVTAESAKLRAQYGGPAIDQFFKVFDFAVNDAWKRAGQDNLTFPAPATLNDHDLALAVVQNGTGSDSTFWTGLMLDKTISHKVHLQVMDDIDAKYGEPADAAYHRIANQLFYDVAQAMGVTSEKLAAFH